MFRELIYKYMGLSKGVKASLWFTASNVLVNGISFVTLPIFSRLLTTSEYGEVSVFASWSSVISILCTLTIWGGVFNVARIKYSDRCDEVVAEFQGLATTISLAFMVLTILFMPFMKQALGMSGFMIACMYVDILAKTPFNLWAADQRYNYEYKKLILVTVFISVVGPVLSIIGVLTCPYKVEAKILGGVIVQFVVGVMIFIRNQLRGRKYYDYAIWKYAFLFNVVLVPHYLSMQVLNQADRIMINRMCGSADAGIYSVAYNIAMLMTLIINGINSSFTPSIYKHMKGGNADAIRRQTTIVTLFIAILTLGVILFMPDLFFLLLPDSYNAALYVIPPVAASAYFLFIYPLFGSIEFYYEENWYTTVASSIGACCNVILNYIFIKRFGFIAAAYTTLFCYIGFSVAHYIFMKKAIKKRDGLKKIYDIKKLLIISVLVVVGSITITAIYDYTIVRWTVIMTMLLVLIINRKHASSVMRTIKGELQN